MEAAEILTALRERGARAQVLDGDRIGIEPSSALTDSLRAAVRAHRHELLAVLRAAFVDRSLEEAAITEARAQLGAVLVKTRRFGHVWIAVDPCLAPNLQGEEQAREIPRPVLLVEDVVRLRGKQEKAIRAVLQAAAVFPGARVVQ